MDGLMQQRRHRGMALELDGIDSAVAAPPQSALAAPVVQDSEAIRPELERIPSLAPWMDFVAHDASLSEEINAQLATYVSEQVVAELSRIFMRLKRQQREREAAGALSPRAARALLESRLVVEAKRGIDLERIVANTLSAMRTAQLMADQANKARSLPLRGPDGFDSGNGNPQSAARAWRRGSMTVAAIARKTTSPRWKGTGAKDQTSDATARKNKRSGTINISEHSAEDTDDDSVFAMGNEAVSSLSESSSLLCVQFPSRDPRTLSEMLAEDEENRRASKENKERNKAMENEETTDEKRNMGDNNSDEDEVTGFWKRAVPDSAIEDATSPVSRREPPSDRVRYIMSTRLGALPPTKRILDEYPIPKEILDALERHRHFHIDEFSLETSFDPIRVSNDTSDGNNVVSPTTGWECYLRRSVPLERKPVSFVLASLAVAREQPVPPPSDIFHQHVLAAANSEAAMLAEVRQLYDHVHDAYREFRSTLHQNLDVSYLVDLAFRSSLNSSSFFLDDDIDDGSGNPVVPIEVTVKIPQHLQKRAAAFNSNSSKWRAAKKGATRMSNRRGAIALNVKSEAATVVQRNEILNKLTTFSAQEVRLMELWHSHDPDNNNSSSNGTGVAGGDEATSAPLDPIPMPPVLSARFEAVWRELQMPAEERLDLAIKYSSLTGSTRLADAVTLWELDATLIREREGLLRLIRGAATTSRTGKSSAVVATEVAMLQDLMASSVALKEALVLTYVEVGDFVTYGGNFYLARMEYEATELRELVLQSIDAAKRRPNEDAALSDGTKIGAQSIGRRMASD